MTNSNYCILKEVKLLNLVDRVLQRVAATGGDIKQFRYNETHTKT